MRDVIINLFGEYQPIIDETTGAIASGMAGVDWAYVLGVLGFFIVLYSAFRLLGVFFK